jgi:hypothetical protein
LKTYFFASFLVINLEFGKKSIFLETFSALGQSNLYKVQSKQVHLGAIFVQDQLFQSKILFSLMYFKNFNAISSFSKIIG